ncbi:helix-turn-helix transcriptional regulator [Kribbella capetownensis]|uniref:helix-turn-helix transcriptional regulator n=1 Tax=Kribbella capetownensis TaxID=1572659 RepID=UPI00192E2068|nr:LuxR family transcriptional regulator [Kribbella capetownensis]
MTIGGAAQELRGRRAECAQLDRVVSGVRSGQGQVLVVRGEAGIGKSALLDYLAGHAGDCRVARAAGVEAEMELPFAGLHQLCLPLMDHVDQLPRPQREALAVAFGLEAGGPPDRFLVSAAALSLLAEASDQKPLLCVIDDAQWLDQASAQALTFVGRRLFADRIGLVFAVREPVTGPEWRGLPELVVGRLSDPEAGALLDSVVPGRLDEHVRDRIVAETRGNPLALLELPHGLTAAELAGGFERPDARPLASQIEQNFAQRLRALPPETQKLLLTAAAEPVGDVPLLLRALGILGIPVSAAGPAETAGLFEIGRRVRFRHPLVRSASYRAATSADRREVHQAIAAAIDPGYDPDRRAWHRANGADGPDEDIALELISSADRAQRRGGVAATAAFLQRATELTPDPALRAQRAVTAAQVTLGAGAFETALKLLVTADEVSVSALHSAQVNLLRAQIGFASGHTADSVHLLLDAARRIEPLDADLARDTYLDAMMAAMFAGRLVPDSVQAAVSQAARTAPPPTTRRKHDLLLETEAAMFTDGYTAAFPLAREALRAFADEQLAEPADLRWLWLAARYAVVLWDDEYWDVLTARHIRIAREFGDLAGLPLVLNSRVFLHLFAGQFAAATSLVAEIRTISDATGLGLAPYGTLGLTVWRGDVARATPLIAASLEDVRARGEGGGMSFTQWVGSFLMNGLARYPEALEFARAATEDPKDLGVANWALPELIESAMRCNRADLASDAFDRLSEMARASGTNWALGLLARSRAVMAKEPESDYEEAIALLGRTRARVDLARTHLLYGEWLRREGRRQDARTQLRTAYEMFTAAGADVFVERTRSELAATGEVVNGVTQRARDGLTAQEAHIADLAGTGLTNAEIGAKLFLSQHTVEWHLRKVFTKLGITSRRQLRPTPNPLTG